MSDDTDPVAVFKGIGILASAVGVLFFLLCAAAALGSVWTGPSLSENLLDTAWILFFVGLAFFAVSTWAFHRTKDDG